MFLIGTERRKNSKLVTILFVAGALFGVAAETAEALDAREAQAVVTVLERLVEETGGSVFYDEDAAQDWFEADDGSSRYIQAAGFSEDSWKTAFDQTMMGFIASIPRPEVEQMMESLAYRIGEISDMSAEQKQAANEMLRTQKEKMEVVRQQGAQYAVIVAPHAVRLKLLTR
jgi:hypothetical protein